MSTETEPRIDTIEVLLQVWFHDGNDPVEAVTHLPIIPRKGDKLNTWMNTPRGSASSGEEDFIDVTDVVLCTYAPERIVVLLGTDGRTREEMADVMAAIDRNDQP